MKTALIGCITHILYWTAWNQVETIDYSRILIVETKKGFSSEYHSNFTSTAEEKSKPLFRPNSLCFWEPSWCDSKIPLFSVLNLQIKSIRTKWCENRANSMHFTHPILNRLERGWNVRILPNTYHWNKKGFSSEYHSNFTSMAKRTSMILIRPNSIRF
jgi:hypothetical protein